jgi:hypothetical protein
MVLVLMISDLFNPALLNGLLCREVEGLSEGLLWRKVERVDELKG